MARRQRGRTNQEARGRECCQAWLTAIEDATAILRSNGRNRSSTEPRNLADSIDASLQYLVSLETILQELQDHWDKPPLKMPPRFPSSHGISNTSSVSAQIEAASQVLVTRRVLIRVVTSQSEVLAKQASQWGRSQQWMLGAETYGTSLGRIHYALELADSEFARLMFEEEDQQSAQWLTRDAEIVEVAVRYLTQEREKYRREANHQANKLRKKLQPQWSSRDEVKAQMGEERWRSNPSPKHDYAKVRKQDEKQLWEIEAAIQRLDAMDLPAEDAVGRRYSQQQQPARGQQRYNGLRPTDYSRRVSVQDYPDPTNFGWTFTGSWRNVEFFEREQDEEGLVKMDWFFTTATIKTSLHHPTQGKTQLFGAKVTPEIYLRILLNPRVHTNVRYQTTEGAQTSE